MSARDQALSGAKKCLTARPHPATFSLNGRPLGECRRKYLNQYAGHLGKIRNMIEGDTLLIELNGSFYFVEASRDVGNFSARPTNTTEPITDPEILAELYTASRGLIFSESLLFPFGESIIDQTNELAVSFDEVRSSSIFDFGSEQSLEIIYESANEFNELLAAVVAGIKGGS